VLEEDGTEIDVDVDVLELAGSTFILLEKEQRWSSAAASAPVPEPSQPPEAPSVSDHPQPTVSSTNISKKIQVAVNLDTSRWIPFHQPKLSFAVTSDCLKAATHEVN